ncbi:T9SS type A sorting domain-containing protein [Hymenobacter elongatus]|uniref:T9SS type A sorting domain-containing protein n=1 Tax=Hymenobacter elongatus TaxID=877208 RepID=A0A4Z0PKS1_9BACT|nr:T9SS type A sorting domain-containing protein [Hymenobacter elongatus]TGE16435.1 T9SS type A sorting domain-containing protein [Hymenobacter elongatus]
MAARIVLFLGLLLATSTAKAQISSWAGRPSTTPTASTSHVTLDVSNSTTLAGTQAFGNNGGANGIFVLKHGGPAQNSWQRNIGNTSLSMSGFGNVTGGLAGEDGGDVYLAGSLYLPFTDNGLTYAPGTFVSRLRSADGFTTWLWQPAAGESGSMGEIVVSSTNRLFVSGTVRTTLTFGSTLTAFPGDETTGFVGTFSASGLPEWATTLHAPGLRLQQLVTDGANRVSVFGEFSQQLTLGSTTLTAPDAGSGSFAPHPFVATYSATGVLLDAWLAPDEAQSLGVDAGGNIFLAGAFTNSLVLDGTTLTAPGPAHFVAKFSPAHALLWTRLVQRAAAAAEPGLSLQPKIAVDPAGNCYTGAGFSGTVDIGPTTLTGGTNQGETFPRGEYYTLSYAPDGTLRWARQSYADNRGFNVRAFAANMSGVAIGGSFGGSGSSFDPVRIYFGSASTSGPKRFINAFGAYMGDTPLITALSPGLGTTGTAVTISGSNLGSTTELRFGSLAQPSFTASPEGTSLATTAPDGVLPGYVTASTPEGKAVSPGPFLAGPTTWTGATSSDWFEPANWTGGVPTASRDALIPAGVVHNPVIGAGAAAVDDLTLQGGTLNITGGTLSVQGAFVNNGGSLVQTGSGGLAFTGTTAQVLGGNGGTVQLASLTVGPAGAELQGPVQVQQVLTLTGNLISNGNLILLGDANGTAMVIATGTGIVIGAVTVQYYAGTSGSRPAGGSPAGSFPATAARQTAAGTEEYTQLASPITAATISSLATPEYTPVVNPAFNSLKSPKATVSPMPSVFKYTETVATNGFWRGWQSPAALSEALTPGSGYNLRLGGSTTFALTGTLNTGSISSPPLLRTRPAGGWQLLGNPYPSLLDWRVVAATLPASVGRALYVYEREAGTFRYYVNGIGNPLVDVMQAFFVRVVGPVGGIATGFSFTDAARTAYLPRASAFVPPADQRPQVRLLLRTASGSTDETAVYFDSQATAAAEAKADAWKIPVEAAYPMPAGSARPELSSWAGTELLAINGLPALTAAPVAVPLNLTLSQNMSCTITATLRNVPASTAVLLHDQKGNRTYDLRLSAGYQFVGNIGNLDQKRLTLQLMPGAQRAASASVSEAVSVYPQPAREAMLVQLPSTFANGGAVRLQLLNTFGHVLVEQLIPADRLASPVQVSLQGKPAGVYTLRLLSGSRVVSQRVLHE